MKLTQYIQSDINIQLICFLLSHYKDMEILPHGTMFDDDISFYATKLKIPYFIGVKMRDELIGPPQKPEYTS